MDEFDADANHSYLWKSFGAVAGIYLFFIADKLIKIVLEARKRYRDYELKRFSGNNSESGLNGTETSNTRSRQSSDALMSYIKEGTVRDSLVNDTDASDAVGGAMIHKESLHQVILRFSDNIIKIKYRLIQSALMIMMCCTTTVIRL